MATKKSIVTKVTDKVAGLYEEAKNVISGSAPRKAPAKKTLAVKATAKKASAKKTVVKKAIGRRTKAPAKKK